MRGQDNCPRAWGPDSRIPFRVLWFASRCGWPGCLVAHIDSEFARAYHG